MTQTEQTPDRVSGAMFLKGWNLSSSRQLTHCPSNLENWDVGAVATASRKQGDGGGGRDLQQEMRRWKRWSLEQLFSGNTDQGGL